MKESVRKQTNIMYQYIDFSNINLLKNLNDASAGMLTKNVSHITDLDVSMFIKQLLDNSEGQIMDQKIIQKIIQNQFQKTKSIQIVLGITYFFFFYIPFIYQLFSKDSQGIKTANIVCLVYTIISIIPNLIKFRDDQKEYFKKMKNMLEVIQIVVYIIHFVHRIRHLHNVLPRIDYVEEYIKNDAEHYGDHMQSMNVMIMFNSILLVTSGLKVMNYLRVLEAFGKLVNLIQACIIDLIPLLICMYIWLVTFTFLYQIFGISFNTKGEI